MSRLPEPVLQLNPSCSPEQRLRKCVPWDNRFLLSSNLLEIGKLKNKNFKIYILFIFRERGREREREEEKHGLAALQAQPGSWPTTRASALTGNWTPSPRSHTSPGWFLRLSRLGRDHSWAETGWTWGLVAGLFASPRASVQHSFLDPPLTHFHHLSGSGDI